MHVCAIRHAKGQTQGTMLMICTALACNLTMRLTLVSILQVFAVLRALKYSRGSRIGPLKGAFFEAHWRLGFVLFSLF